MDYLTDWLIRLTVTLFFIMSAIGFWILVYLHFVIKKKVFFIKKKVKDVKQNEILSKNEEM